MKDNVELSVYSPFGKKLCELYNSACQFSGQATDLSIKKTIGELSTLTFSLPTVIEDENGALIDNFRWDFIKNENLIYITIDGKTDVYKIKTPEDTVSGKKHSMTVSCLHRSENLKTRNLTQSYDTITANAKGHLEKALEGTGWGIGKVDTFNEEKIFEKKIPLTQGFVRAPSDMAFGSYAEIVEMSGHSAWNAEDGWLSASPRVVSIGKNLFDGMLVLGHLDTTTGAPVYINDSLRYYSINFIYVRPFAGETLTLSGIGFSNAEFLWFGAEKNLLSVDSGILQTTIPANAVWMKFMLWADENGEEEFTAAPSSIQAEIGPATEYEKYKAPFEIVIGALGKYDAVDRSTITRATGYNEFDHTVYETTPTQEKFSPAAVKLYNGGLVYLENLGVGTLSCKLIYTVEDPTDAMPKEMVRSASKEAGASAYDNLKSIASLFDGSLVFDGYAKTVSLVKLIGKKSNVCFRVGKNMKSIKRTRNTTDIITRLYVIDQTSENGYIGIEEVNPLGTSFILDFDYYKEAGLLSQAQLEAIDTYKDKVKEISSEYRGEVDELFMRQNTVNGLVGQSPFAFANASYTTNTNVSLGEITRYNDAGDPEFGDSIYIRTALNTWQTFTVVSYNKSSRVVTLSGVPVGCVDALWTKKHPAGTIGARLVEIKTKREIIKKLQAQYEDATDEDERTKIIEDINALQTELDSLYNGTADTPGFNNLLASLMLETAALNVSKKRIAELDEQYAKAGEAFDEVMGDAISDGIFPQGEYADGQELTLYADAVKYLHEAARPKVEYTIDGEELSKVEGYELERIGYGDIVYVSEERLGIYNLEATVTSYTETPLSLKLNSFNVGNYKDSTKWMEDIVAATKKIKSKSKIYDRAQSIDPNGLINPDILTESLNANDVGARLDLSNNEALQGLVTQEEATAMLGYRVEILSSHGSMLTDRVRTTVLRAYVYRGNEDVTYLFPPSCFNWKRTSQDAMGDAAWNSMPEHRGTKMIELTTADVVYEANITCEVSTPD